MAYAALGRVRRNWLHLFEVIYKEYARSTVTIQQFPIANLKRALGLSMGEAIKTQDAKDIAATSQVPRSIRRCSALRRRWHCAAYPIGGRQSLPPWAWRALLRSQAAFEKVVLEIVHHFRNDPAHAAVDGLILTGGCALNVVLNQKVSADSAASPAA